MNEQLPDMSVDAGANGASSTTRQALAELERRIESLESRVAALPDAQHIEEHITERVKASLPVNPPPVDSTRAPSYKDIEFPMPSVQSIVETAKATWTFLEMLNEFKTLFWTLFDRRYDMAWPTRFFAAALLILIFTSHWWAPFAVYDNFISHLWDKVIDLALGMVLFMILIFEMRRYKNWRTKS